MEVETKFFYSPCMKYLKTKLILLLNNIQNFGYLKGQPVMTYTNTEIVYSILLPWIVLLRNCPFLVR